MYKVMQFNKTYIKLYKFASLFKFFEYKEFYYSSLRYQLGAGGHEWSVGNRNIENTETGISQKSYPKKRPPFK